MADVAICFFSATGNGFYIAKEMKKYIQGDLLYIPKIIRKDLSEYKKIIIITPIYLFAIPNIVKRFINSIPKLSNDTKVYIVINYAGLVGNASYYIKSFCAKKGVNICAVCKVAMPLTYTLFAEELQLVVKRLIKTSPKRVKKVADKINANQQMKIRSNCFAFLSKLHDKTEWKWGSFAKEKFQVAASCDLCGYCKKICPAENIEIKGGKVHFKEQCISCLACYHRCPQKSINCGHKTIGRKRYVNPNVNLDEMYI